jgi:hypothetical protein
VRDPEGNFRVVPSVENPWDDRQPFYPTKAEPSRFRPLHHMLDLPF